MLPICMVNAETMAQVPEDVLVYLRALRRRIIELEQADPQQRIAFLEAANRALQVGLDDALALIAQHQKQIGQLQQRPADAKARQNPNPTTPPLPPSSDSSPPRPRPPPPADEPRKKRGGQSGHPRHLRLLAPAELV